MCMWSEGQPVGINILESTKHIGGLDYTVSAVCICVCVRQGPISRAVGH